MWETGNLSVCSGHCRESAHHTPIPRFLFQRAHRVQPQPRFSGRGRLGASATLWGLKNTLHGKNKLASTKTTRVQTTKTDTCGYLLGQIYSNIPRSQFQETSGDRQAIECNPKLCICQQCPESAVEVEDILTQSTYIHCKTRSRSHPHLSKKKTNTIRCE